MPALSTAKPPALARPRAFETEAEAVMRELHDSVGELLRAASGPIQRAVDVKRVLGLETTLAWQVFRLSRSSMLREAANVPSPATMRRFLDAARAKRLPAPAVERVFIAFEAFETLARDHAGDREGLIGMLASRSAEWDDKVALKFRKSAFRANSHIFGRKAQTRYITNIYHPRADGADDILIVQGTVGLQSTRESQPLRFRTFTKRGSASVLSPGDPSAPRGPETHSLIEEFCTQPLPEMQRTALSGGGEDTELVFPGCGRAAAVTLYTSIVLREPHEEARGKFNSELLVIIPYEEFVVDTLIPVGWSDVGAARLAVYGPNTANSSGKFERRAQDLLPQRETMAYLGELELPPDLEGVPQQRRAVRHMLDRLGWLGTRFDVFRCRVRYPVLNSLLCQSVDDVRS